MEQPPEIHLKRTRVTCPFCRDEVTGGHVWLCPECGAQQHAECLSEHGGSCASCGTAERPDPAPEAAPPPALQVSLKEEPREEPEPLDPSHTPAWAASRADALRAQGFSVETLGPHRVSAFHPAWSYSGLLARPQSLRVVLRQVGALRAGDVLSDYERHGRDDHPVLVFYVADEAPRSVEDLIQSGDLGWRFFPVLERPGRAGCFRRLAPSAHFGAVTTQPGLRYLARLLLNPGLSPVELREGVTAGDLRWLLLGVLTLVGIAAALWLLATFLGLIAV